MISCFLVLKKWRPDIRIDLVILDASCRYLPGPQINVETAIDRIKQLMSRAGLELDGERQVLHKESELLEMTDLGKEIRCLRETLTADVKIKQLNHYWRKLGFDILDDRLNVKVGHLLLPVFAASLAISFPALYAQYEEPFIILAGIFDRPFLNLAIDREKMKLKQTIVVPLWMPAIMSIYGQVTVMGMRRSREEYISLEETTPLNMLNDWFRIAWTEKSPWVDDIEKTGQRHIVFAAIKVLKAFLNFCPRLPSEVKTEIQEDYDEIESLLKDIKYDLGKFSQRVTPKLYKLFCYMVFGHLNSDGLLFR